MTDSERSRWSWPRIVGAALAFSALVSASGLGGAAIVATWGPGVWSWGDVPGWIEAVATVLAALGAGIAVVYAKSAFDLERKRDGIREAEQQADRDRRTKRERRAQAELVCTWLEQTPLAMPPQARLIVRNGSNLPILDVSTTAQRGRTTVINETTAMIAPGQDAAWPVLRGSDADWTAVGVKSVAAFTDSHGVRWWRSSEGALADSPPTAT